MVLGMERKHSVPEVTINNETSLVQHETDQSKSCLYPKSSLDEKISMDNKQRRISDEEENNLRQKLCILLLTLLHAYAKCKDLTNINHLLARLQEFRHSLHSSKYISFSYFLGEDDCRLSSDSSKSSYKPDLLDEFEYLRNKVSKGELESVCYLKLIIATADNMDKFLLIPTEKLLPDFILLIDKLSLHNETAFYDIIKTLCDLEIQPEIQDMFILELTDYIHVKCNKQYRILSNFLLDINMTCKKGEFLQKLTINMGQHILFDKEDTVIDVEKIIYRCFCIVRHENKVNANKDTNIEKYRKYFSFIPKMLAEEEMKNLSHLRSFLVMLILFIFSSCGSHKSAQLNKYLSLKYAYEDAILYLLWCSGDVENNPGPTLRKLERKADSVKKRNWIHDMCTTALKLLKNKALDSKTDLWKEKPDGWQELHGDKPFYDPRNKPKGKQYSMKTDEELLNCLFKCCDRISMNLPCNLRREITLWRSDKSDIALLLELYISRQEIEAMKMAKNLLIKYADTSELKKYMKDYDVGISFNQNIKQKTSPKGYSDVVRDLAITFCRVSKDLHIFEKSDGMWKTPPQDWNPDDLYSSPCNTAKRHEKHQDQQLVDNLLSYCEKKSKSIPSELQLVVNAWKLKNECKLEKSREICDHYTIWSSMAIIQHSLKYLEIEGLLEKPDVQLSLKQIGVSLHCEKSPNQLNNDSTVTTDNEGKVSGLPTNSLSDNQIGTDSSSPSSSASDSDIVCSQNPYEAKALTNSHTKKSVIKCSKPDFQNHPSTSGCTIYSTLVPCPDSRGDLQYTDERLDIPDSQKCVSEIKCQDPDFQPSSSGCSTFTNRAEYINVRKSVPPKIERIQKRSRPSSKERSDKRPRLHSGNESQASTPSTTRCTDDTTPSSHCDLENADQNVHSSDEEVDQDLSSNRIPVPDNIQDTDSSNTQLSGSGDEIPQHLLQHLNTYISCNNLEEILGEDLEQLDIQLKLWETL